jgi:hypothetical protein
MRTVFVAATILSLGWSTGCATIVNGTTQKITIQSEPTDANVRIDGTMTVTTPAIVELKRNQKHIVEIEKPGYASQTINIKSELNGMVFGNILFGGIIGGGVDAASGAAARLSPSEINVTLLRPGQTPPPTKTVAEARPAQ